VGNSRSNAPMKACFLGSRSFRLAFGRSDTSVIQFRVSVLARGRQCQTATQLQTAPNLKFQLITISPLADSKHFIGIAMTRGGECATKTLINGSTSLWPHDGTPTTRHSKVMNSIGG
jgi:hypothetical protein